MAKIISLQEFQSRADGDMNYENAIKAFQGKKVHEDGLLLFASFNEVRRRGVML